MNPCNIYTKPIIPTLPVILTISDSRINITIAGPVRSWRLVSLLLFVVVVVVVFGGGERSGASPPTRGGVAVTAAEWTLLTAADDIRELLPLAFVSSFTVAAA